MSPLILQGIDDTVALFFALSSSEIEVLGVTTTFGNVSIEHTTDNALRLLEIAGRTDIKVYKGANHPLASHDFRDAGRVQRTGFRPGA